MDYSIVIKPLIGAVIGYSTNWLAIKMLFRPREEKRIGPVHVPFTPGIIPRERERIAKSLGQAVGDQLLTEEVIEKELLDQKVIDHIKNYVINDLMATSVSLREILSAVLKDESPLVEKKLRKYVGQALSGYLRSDEVRAMLTQVVRTYIVETMPYNAYIGDVVPGETSEVVADVMETNMPEIRSYLVELAGGEEVKARIAGAIETLVIEKVGALGAMFLDPQGMAEAVVAYVAGLLQEEEVQSGIIHTVSNGVEQLRGRQVSDTLSFEVYQRLIDGAAEKLLSGIYSKTDEVSLTTAAEPIIEKLLTSKITLTAHEKEMIESQVETLYVEFIHKNIGTFLGTFDVSGIVESEIKGFSVIAIEQLIFAIVDKEFRAITWLGGVLGFLIGLVYMVI